MDLADGTKVLLPIVMLKAYDHLWVCKVLSLCSSYEAAFVGNTSETLVSAWPSLSPFSKAWQEPSFCGRLWQEGYALDYGHNNIFLKELNFIIYYSNVNSNDFNILDATDDQVINLIVTKALEHSLITTNFVNLLIRVVVDSDCSRYSFANRSMFIIYEKIYSRSIKGIERSEVQS